MEQVSYKDSAGMAEIMRSQSQNEIRMENLRMLPQLKSLKKLLEYAILCIESDIIQVQTIDEMVAYAKKSVC